MTEARSTAVMTGPYSPTVAPDMTVSVVGRHPVAELLRVAPGRVRRVLVARSARGGPLDVIGELAASAGVPFDVVGDRRLDAVAGVGAEHQGVVAEAVLAAPGDVEVWLADRRGVPVNLLVVDGVTTPANLGILLRSSVAAGLDAVVIPATGTAGLGAAALKASAGIALAATVLSTPTIEDAIAALSASAVSVVALDAGGEDLFDAALPRRGAYVVGNESTGISAAVRAAAETTVSLPMAPGVESLNVAAAGTVLFYELVRRGVSDPRRDPTRPAGPGR